MKEKILTLLGIVFFVLVILNTITVLYFYKQYSVNIDIINQENGLTRAKLEGLDKDSEGFKGTIETINSQLKSYEESILMLENRVSSGENNANEISSKFQKVRTDVEDWQKKYDSALGLVAELKDKTEKLAADVEQLKNFSSGNVNLGKISVQGQAGSAKGSKKK